MKKILSIALLAAFMLGLEANTASLDETYGYITVNTYAETSVAPDIAEVSIAVITEDNKSMQVATQKNRELSDKVIASLKSMIDTSKGDYIKTSDFNASPIYNYTRDGKKVLNKYQVSNSVIVHTKAMDKVGTMIDKSLVLGATNVNSLNFSLSSYDSQCTKLIEEASQKAKDRVNAAAKTIPSSIYRVKSMNVSCSSNNSVRPQYRMLKSNALMSAGASADQVEETSISIEQGVIKLNANVSATYYVK